MPDYPQCAEVWCPKCCDILFTLHDKPVAGRPEGHYEYYWKQLKGQTNHRKCQVCGTNLERKHG